MKKGITLLIALVFVISCAAPTFAAGKIKLSNKTVTMKVGKTKTISLKRGKKTIKTGVKWKSSNKKIVTVSKGKLTAKSVGKATVTATYKKKKYRCKVTVKAPAYYKDTSTIKCGNAFTFKANAWYVGDEARDHLKDAGIYKSTYDQDIEAGGTLVMIRYKLKMFRDCTEDDIWSVLGEYFKKASASSGSAGEAMTLAYDKSHSLYKGDRITAYEVGILNHDYNKFYSMILTDEGERFFVQHKLK